MKPLIAYFKLALRPGPDILLFALRTVAAGLLCLYLAFVFDLDQPKWALMTVIIISLPLAGMTLKRSFAQVLGTAGGASAAVVIMALFPQQPVLFATGSQDAVIDGSRRLSDAAGQGTFFEIPGRHHFNAPGSKAFRQAALEFLQG